MRNETAEAKKGSHMGKEEMHPRPKAQRRGRARANPTFFRGRGGRVCTSSPLATPASPGERGRDGAAGVRTGKQGRE